jgi:hypothetical protein
VRRKQRLEHVGPFSEWRPKPGSCAPGRASRASLRAGSTRAPAATGVRAASPSLGGLLRAREDDSVGALGLRVTRARFGRRCQAARPRAPIEATSRLRPLRCQPRQLCAAESMEPSWSPAGATGRKDGKMP